MSQFVTSVGFLFFSWNRWFLCPPPLPPAQQTVKTSDKPQDDYLKRINVSEPEQLQVTSWTRRWRVWMHFTKSIPLETFLCFTVSFFLFLLFFVIAKKIVFTCGLLKYIYKNIYKTGMYMKCKILLVFCKEWRIQ